MNILVTGGSSGLGKALVKMLAPESGNTISFTYCKGKTSADELESTYSNVHAYHVDFTNISSVDDFAMIIPDLQIDVLINNAYSGQAQGTHFHKTDINDFTKAFLDNLLPTIKVTQACIIGMRKRKFGKIVNIITSYVMDVPPAGFSIYASTKAYLRQLSRSLSKEYGKYNITSNCVLPEYMVTSFGKVEDFQLEQMISNHPLKQLLKPEEVAEIICSIIHSSQQLNGVDIPINAAQHIM